MPNQSYSKQVEETSNKLVGEHYELGVSASYYDATYRVKTIGISTPKEMESLTASIGWPRMYLDAIEERLDLEGFRLPQAAPAKPAAKKIDPLKNPDDVVPEQDDSSDELVKRLLEWWQSNNLDEMSGLAHLDALVYGRSYITISAPGPDDIDQDTPLIRVESPLNMYADIDPRTGKVRKAIRLYRDPNDAAQQWAMLYTTDEIVPLKLVGERWLVDRDFPKIRHKLGICPVVPMLNRERLNDRNGRSEITPEIRSFTDAASRTMMNLQSAAELMAVPQRVIFGLDPNALADPNNKTEVLQAYMAQILAVENESGKAQQFTSADLRNFVEALEEIAKHVASYTGLPPQYLSFMSDNPASAEAIKSAESRLVKKCERKARMFGGAWEQVMRIAVLIMDGAVPPEMYRLQSVWRDPSTPTYAAKADGVSKLYSNGQGIIPKRRARQDMGYTDTEIEQMELWDKEDQAEMMRLSDILNPQPDPDDEDDSDSSSSSATPPSQTNKAPTPSSQTTK